MKINNKEIILTVMSSVKKYLMEIKKFIPDYTGPARGRKQTSVFKSLSKKDQESLKFFENEIKLEKNRTAAKKNRLKKKNLLEKLQYEVDSLKNKNYLLELENKRLRENNGRLREDNERIKEDNERIKEESYICSIKSDSSVSPVFTDSLDSVLEDIDFDIL